MLLPHLYTDETGHSVLDEIDLNMKAPGGGDAQEGTYYRRINTSRQPIEYWQIGHALPGHFIDFTPVEKPTLIAVFSGQMTITASNGEERVLARGDMLIAEDIGGQGHMTQFMGMEPCEYLVATMKGPFK